jgi:2-polyprenyl-3-methyl-5-hydroxy-6-metoxy-1,4-benzoquinol methylase
MNYTGERPTFEDIEAIRSSKLRYHSIRAFCSGKSILDMGCGIGHGTYFLAKYTEKRVLGYDSCSEAILEAAELFNLSNLRFTDILPDFHDFDVITMIEFIEHLSHEDGIKFLTSIALDESIQPIVAMTTPNGDVFPYHPSTEAEYRGFHKWHYTLDDLQILKQLFSFVEIYGHMYDPIIQKFTSYVIVATNQKI